MLKVRVILVYLFDGNVLLDESGELPYFFLLNDDDVNSRLIDFTKKYFKYPSVWLDFNIAEAIVQKDSLFLVYGILVGKDNIKGKWKNVTKLNENKEKDLQRIVYSASRVV